LEKDFSHVWDMHGEAFKTPMHLYCADTEEDVQFCIEKGASLITANDPSALLKLLR